MPISVKNFGSLINGMLPINIKQNSAAHNLIDKFYKMQSESETYTASGSVLMSGVNLTQAYGATGYNVNVRLFQDCSSRMYVVKAVG